ATGCDTVQNSPYAILFGIPVSLLGMLGFTAYIVLALIGLRSGAPTRGYLHALLVLSIVEVGFTFYMAYLQLTVIRAVVHVVGGPDRSVGRAHRLCHLGRAKERQRQSERMSVSSAPLRPARAIWESRVPLTALNKQRVVVLKMY